MFRDVQDLLFTQDGVPAGLVRAGEPRVVAREADGVRAAAVPLRRHVPLRRWLRSATS